MTGGFNHQTDALLEIAAVILKIDEQGKLYRGATHTFHLQPFEGANLEPAALAFTGIKIDHPQDKRMNYGSYPARGRLLKAVASALLGCIAAFAAQATSADTEPLGFTTSPRGHVLVPVSVNGSAPLIFVLDTAAGKTVVTPGIVEKLGLPKAPGEGVSTLGVHGNAVNPEVELQSLIVGDVRVTDVRAVVLDLDHITRGNWHADGILGMDFLKQFDVRLDFGMSMVRFFPGASDRSNCVACPAGSEGIVFESIDPGFIVLRVTVGTTYCRRPVATSWMITEYLLCINGAHGP